MCRVAVFLALVAAASAAVQMDLNMDALATKEMTLNMDALDAPPASNGNIQFSRTVKLGADIAGSVTIDHGCTSKDAYGSNDCELDWGSDYKITLNGTIKKDLNQGSTMSVAMKMDSIIPFNFECPLCGGNCTVTVPVIKKEFSFAMPACPIAAFSGSKTIPVSLPSKDPLPVKISAKGTVSIFDETKTMQGQVTLDVTLS